MMKKRKGLYVILILISVVLLSFANGQPLSEAGAAKGNSKVKDFKVEEYFKDINGTFVLRDLRNEKTFVYNKSRANERFAPQSTFKVPNSLIGLQVGAVEDEYDIKYWDGIEREIPVWNQDHVLGSAMRNSVVWYYQAMAHDIGMDRMDEWVHKISYGNEDISGGIDQFWLSSSLKISPVEQVEFLESLYREELPFDQDVMKTVKRMTIQDEGDDYILYGKTGQGSGIGWYVGFIKNDKRAYSFAANIDGTSADAKGITLEILEKYGLMGE